MFFHMYIAPEQGQTTLCGQNPDVNRKAFAYLLQVSKKCLWSLYIMFLYMYIAPGQGQTTP